MPELNEHIAGLLLKQLKKETTPEEELLLKAWSSGSPEREALLDKLKQEHFIKSGIQEAASAKRKTMAILAAHGIQLEEEREPVTSTSHRIHFLRTAWFRYAAAIIIIAGIGAYLWNTQQKEKPASTDEASAKAVKNEIPPGYDRAVLTLSNGQQVQLNNATSQTIEDGTLSIENTNGHLNYTENGRPFSPFEKGSSSDSQRNADRRGISYNTMQTPRGGQYKLTLADGTKVWLNAASSITYPVAFLSSAREVSVSGEVYFEVAKNPAKPFIVNVPYLPLAGVAAQRPRVDRERSERTGDYRITVLGTHFNVNAYPDENSINTTLLEGAVKINVSTVHAPIVLKPGQQGRLTTTEKRLSLAVNPDLEQVMAWKNGSFNFRDMDLEAVFRQLGRWYDVDIKYAGAVPAKKIRGKMGRDLNLAEVLKALKGMGIETHMEGRTLVILPG